jgi:hypothetical protein
LNVTYAPLPTAEAVHNSSAPVKAVCGPVGSGKSLIACWDFFFLCYESKVPIRGVVIREAYRELRDSTRATWMEWFRPITVYRERDEIAHITFQGKDGKTRTHELHFRSCRRPEEASKFLSTEFGFIWLEEVCPAFSLSGGVVGGGLDRGIFEIALMRVRQKGAPRHQIILTFNPPTTRHWAYELFFRPSPADLEKKGYKLWRIDRTENEANLPPGYYDRLRGTLSPDLYRRFVEGQVTTIYPGERVFPECIDDHHIVDALEPVAKVPLVLGFDYGLRPCALITQITPAGQWRWLKELQVFNAGVETLIEYLVPLLNQDFPGFTWRCWDDPNAGGKRAETDAQAPRDLLAARGFRCQPGAVDLFTRIETMKQRFARSVGTEPAIVISRSGCPIAVEALLGGYRYPRSYDGRIGNKPLKNEFSDLIDAGEYIATGEFSLLHGGRAAVGLARERRMRGPRWDPLATPKPRRRARSWLST